MNPETPHDDQALPLFPDSEPEPKSIAERPQRSPAAGHAPLPERMRPRTIDEMVGQSALLGEGGTLRRLLEAGHIPSLILHGPPGCGKTTLARLIAGRVDAAFVPFSAVSEGVPRLREIVRESQLRRKAGRHTLLFIDEIHRLNKGQQDFLLPYVESGLVTLVGATTEHPAFEVNAALLSRATVIVLESLRDSDLKEVIRRALEDPERGLGSMGVQLTDEATDLLVQGSAGDARQALGALDTAARLTGGGDTINADHVREALQKPLSKYDTTTAFQMLSAFHKSLRASDGSAALYWGMRMVRAGEDPMVLFRRLIAAAYEDVGLADPRAGQIATQGMQAFERLGAPEGFLPLANAILYVATAPKSNRAYLALKAAVDAADEHPNAPVPLHLRNASTSLMKEWGFGADYKYAHNYEGSHVDMQCLPDELASSTFYEASDQGFEIEIAERLKNWKAAE